jgi:hypothetical protein
MEENIKPINTVFSVDSILDIKELVNAKILMNEKYGNIYSHIPPHLAYTIMPFPEYNFDLRKKDIKEYIERQKPFPVFFSDLKYESKSNFFYISVEGEEILKHHRNITEILNKYRDTHIREKDLGRLNKGEFDDISTNYLINYGYARVFDNFRSHITIGNFTIEKPNVEEIEKELRDILNPILEKEILIDNIHTVIHTDSAHSQSEMKTIWEKVFMLEYI